MSAPQQGSRILNAYVAKRQAERRPLQIKTRGFDAANNDHLTFGWSASNASANYDIERALESVRGRSRNLAANNDYMRKFLRMVDVNIVGPDGFRYKNLSVNDDGRPDEAARTLLELHHARWARPGMCDITARYGLKQIFKLAVKACARDGEYLLRRVRGKAARNPYGYALQILDIDRLDVRYTGDYAPTGNRIIMGVEVDEVMRPVAYHLLTNHPGDSYTGRNGQRYERVPASNIFHGGISERPEQVRYMPWGHTAMLRLEMLGKFQTAALVQARRGAETLGVLQQREDVTSTAPPLGGEQGADGATYETSLPGTWDTLPQGYEMKALETKYPSEVFGQFVKDALRGVASGLMVAYNGLANDLEGVNYSSIRAGVLEERDGWTDLQNHFIEHLADQVHADWLEMSLLSGAIAYPSGSTLPASKIEKFAAHSFTGRKWQWVDPKNDAEAADMARSRGWTTDEQITADRGGDWFDNIDQIAIEQDYAAKKKVTLGKPMPNQPQQQAKPAADPAT